MLRKALLFGFIFGFTTFSSFSGPGVPVPSQAQSYQQGYSQGYSQNYQQTVSPAQSLWHNMSSGDRLIVDRLAADFYERSLRYSQNSAIESNTARAYARANPEARAAYRAQRRQQYYQLNQAQQQALRNMKRPDFMHLSETQKWPFRYHALQQLGAIGAIAQSHAQGYHSGI